MATRLFTSVVILLAGCTAHAAALRGLPTTVVTAGNVDVPRKKLAHYLERFIELVPKAELHLHVEGTLEPAMMLELAARNGLPPPYPSVEAAEAAYQFADLQSFLDLYYFGCTVLKTSSDFYDLAYAYFVKAAAAKVVHAEVFFDPQTHIGNGLTFEGFMPGLIAAAENAHQNLGVTASYIMCFRKELSAESALETLVGWGVAWRSRNP